MLKSSLNIIVRYLWFTSHKHAVYLPIITTIKVSFEIRSNRLTLPNNKFGCFSMLLVGLISMSGILSLIQWNHYFGADWNNNNHFPQAVTVRVGGGSLTSSSNHCATTIWIRFHTSRAKVWSPWPKSSKVTGVSIPSLNSERVTQGLQYTFVSCSYLTYTVTFSGGPCQLLANSCSYNFCSFASPYHKKNSDIRSSTVMLEKPYLYGFFFAKTRLM